jgi:hypothetical protein
MRARQFILEYDRTKTAQAFTSKLVTRAQADPTVPGAVRNNINSMENPLKAAEMILQNQIEVGDPTKQKKYTQALAKMYANGLIKWEDIGSTMRDYLTKFATLAVKKLLKPEHSDFNRFKDLKSFYDVVDQYPDPEEKEKKSKGDAKEVYKDANVRIIKPEDINAACYYGQGTRWCTAADSNNMFDRYNRDGPMYIMLPTNPKYEGEKYQIHPDSGQYMNEGDYPVEAQELIDRFGEDFREWLLKADPVLMEMVRYYTNDQELESAWRSVAEYVNDKAYEVMFEWEDSDDYYYSWLKDNNYVDEEGDIKDDAPPYDEYNEEAGAWLHRMTEIPNMTADEIREITQQLSDTDNRDYYLRDLDDVYSYAIEIAQDKNQTAGLEIWVYKNVDVKYNPEKDEITVEKVEPRTQP